MTEAVTDVADKKVEQEAADSLSSTSKNEEHKKDLQTVFDIIKKDPVYPDVVQVVYWRDPIKSGIIFGILNFVYFLLTIAEYSVVTIISYLLLSFLAVAFGYSQYVVLKASWLQGKKVENPFVERFKDETFHISKKAAEQHLDTAVDLLNLLIGRIRDALFCVDLVYSLKFAFRVYLLATLGNWFSGYTLAYLVTLVAFIWPRLYEEKQKEIDHFYGLAVAQIKTYVELGLSKLPPSVTSRFPALKPKAN